MPGPFKAYIITGHLALGCVQTWFVLCRAQAQDLLSAYNSLMQAAGLDNQQHSTAYNCWFTPTLALVAPRFQEQDGACSINALGFAGTILVKSDQDMQHILARGCMKVLTSVGVPWTAR